MGNALGRRLLGQGRVKFYNSGKPQNSTVTKFDPVMGKDWEQRVTCGYNQV